jgi:hypothetical protein
VIGKVGASASFFEIMGWIFLAMVIAGFGVVQITMPEMTRPMRPTLLLHTVLFACWFVLFIVQSRLISARNVALHRRIGQASVVLALSMVVTGWVVIREAYMRPGWSIAGMSAPASAMFPISDMIFFPLAYALAILNRRRGPAHKRFMLFAGLVMLDPALARLVAGLGLVPPAIMAIELALVTAVIIHDRKTLGRVHGATWFGVAMILGTYVLAFGIAPSAAWAGLVTSLLGPAPPV